MSGVDSATNSISLQLIIQRVLPHCGQFHVLNQSEIDIGTDHAVITYSLHAMGVIPAKYHLNHCELTDGHHHRDLWVSTFITQATTAGLQFLPNGDPLQSDHQFQLSVQSIPM